MVVSKEPSTEISTFENCIVLGFVLKISLGTGLAGSAALLPGASENFEPRAPKSVLKISQSRTCGAVSALIKHSFIESHRGR